MRHVPVKRTINKMKGDLQTGKNNGNVDDTESGWICLRGLSNQSGEEKCSTLEKIKKKINVNKQFRKQEIKNS